MTRSMRRLALASAIAASFCWGAEAPAATPTAEQALQLAPIQKDVEYDRPDKAAAAKCEVTSENTGGAAGWLVRTEGGELLRRFLDTNGDNKVDQWCYYRHGVEVYRDLDTDFNGLADQYRWLGTAGTRWGLDENEDGQVDRWQQISAEEVTAELVAALRDRNVDRFKAILISDSELKSLGLGKEKEQEIADKIAKSQKGFSALATKQRLVTAKTEWLNFGGNHPGVLAAGTFDSTQDITVYDNVAAVVETEGKTAQVPVGSLVRVEGGWRLIDLPAINEDLANAAPPGFFFQAMLPQIKSSDAPMEQGLSPEMQKLIAELERVDKDLTAAATPAQQARLNASRADVMEQLVAKAANAEERTNWLRQLADTVSAATQGGGYPEGVQRLRDLYGKLVREKADRNDQAYVKFRYMTAEYTQSLQAEKADFIKIQEKWLKDLEAFIAEYSSADDTAEAMLQLAIAQEFAGQEDEAIKWFDQIAKKFPQHELAKKAVGASHRLNCVGKTIELRAKTVEGRDFDLAAYKGKVVLVHYWSTWCEPCKQDMETLRSLQAKYAKDGFVLVGVNLDSEPAAVADFLKAKRLTWPQLYEPGGLDGRLANEMGILTLPTMLLLDKQGQVVSRNISVGELDTELGKQLR